MFAIFGLNGLTAFADAEQSQLPGNGICRILPDLPKKIKDLVRDVVSVCDADLVACSDHTACWIWRAFLS